MIRLLWISTIVVVIDQLTKVAALKLLLYQAPVELLPFFNLTLVFNTGAAFGFLNDSAGWQNTFFVGVALVVSIVIIVMLKRLDTDQLQTGIGLSMIVGGALGNMIDRVIYGHVIDFLDFYYGAWHWPAFNIADSAITVGAVLLIMESLGLRFGTRALADL
ncbi:MAG: signal peptidase II [Gammaproteobacteria bacterium]|nr:signal peptidase II [Gammaproteobacteria bacterium]